MRQKTTCNHFEHKWEIEEIFGVDQYGGYVQIKLRCEICNAHITGEVIV